MPEGYAKIVQDMYRSSKTQVVTEKGETEYVPIEVGLHQGSALIPFLCIIIMDVLTENIEKDPPLEMMFADDLVLGAMTRREVEEDLETWGVGMGCRSEQIRNTCRALHMIQKPR